MGNEKIAVLLSAYNGEEYLHTQIDSILDQQVDCDLSLIVRDDGSSDGTAAIIKKDYNRPDVTLIAGENVGFVKSFMELLTYAHENLSEYDYFALSDQDDRWDADKLQVAVDKIRKDGRKTPLLYGCLSRLTDNQLNPYKQTDRSGRVITFFNSIIQNFLPGHTYVMNRALLELVFDGDPEKIYAHDHFILNAAVLSNGLIYDETSHADYRQHEGNTLGATNNLFAWLIKNFNRLKRGDGEKQLVQTHYICEKFSSLMKENEEREMERFFNSRKNLFSRVKYIGKTKLYRQKSSENLVFKIHYILGGYNE